MNLKGFCRLWAGRRARWTMLVLCALGLAFVIGSGVERTLHGSSEFTSFRLIVQVSLVENLNHYDEIAHIRAYPPFFAIFWAPWGLFPWGLVPQSESAPTGLTTAQAVQLGLSALALIGLMVWLTFPTVRWIVAACAGDGGGTGCGAEDEHPRCAPALLWIFSGALMLNSVLRCETDMFIAALVAGGMLLILARERPWSGGALLGVAAALKLTPGLFLVYLVCRRRWRALGGMIAAGLVCTVVLPALVWGPQGATERTRSWVEKAMLPYATGGPKAFIGWPYRSTNQSLKAAVVRYLSHYDAGTPAHRRYVNVADLSAASVDRVATLLKLVILAGLLVAWLLPPPRGRRELEPLLFGLVPLGMVLISDVSVGGHFALLVVPLGALICFAFRHAGEPIGRTVSWFALAGFLLANLMAVRWLKEHSVTTAGAVLLYAFMVWLAIRLRKEGAR